MKIDKILTNFVNRDDGKHKRKVGHFYASELNSISKGYLTPDKFFEKKAIDLTGTRMIITGIMSEEILHKIFTDAKAVYEYNIKKDLKISDEITLAVKPDFIFKDFIIETKFPFSMVKDKIPDRYNLQLEAEHRAFGKKVYLGVLSVPFSLRLIEYIPSLRRWNNIKKMLMKFHEELKQL